MNDIWSIANITSTKELQALCLRQIAEDFNRFISTPNFFAHTEFKALALLLRDNQGKASEKLTAISAWIAARRTREVQENREAKFRDLLELDDLSSLPKSSIIDTALDNEEINLPKGCRFKILAK